MKNLEGGIHGIQYYHHQGATLGVLSLSREECADLRDQKRHPTI
jgi:hypothetical protein